MYSKCFRNRFCTCKNKLGIDSAHTSRNRFYTGNLGFKFKQNGSTTVSNLELSTEVQQSEKSIILKDLLTLNCGEIAVLAC